MKTSRLLLLTAKDYVKRPFIWCIVLFMPILAILISSNKDAINSHSITVGYCISKTDNEANKELVDGFDNYEGLYKFKAYDSKETLIKDVKLSKIECGYVIPEDLFERLLSGDAAGSVMCYKSPSTTFDSILNETVFSIVFPTISKINLKNYLVFSSNIKDYYADGSLNTDDIDPIFQDYLIENATSTLSFKGQPDSFELSTQTLLLSPLKGLMAILILLAAFSGALNYYKEAENPVFKLKKVRFVYILIPTFYALISAFISQFITVRTESVLASLVRLLLYSLACVLFVFIITFIIKSPVLFASFIPIFLLGCLIFTPIFIDVASFMSALRPISYLFLPYYYLTI